MKNLILILLLFTALTGCKSVKRDDYVRATLLPEQNLISATEFKFYLDTQLPIDIRGDYSHDRSIEGGNILYQGPPAAALAQLFTHAAIASSLKEEKLRAQQDKANEAILPLRNLANSIQLDSIIAENTFYSSELNPDNKKLVNVKPIFFADSTMTNLSLKLVAWIDLPKSKKSKKAKKMYQNIIEVHAKPLTREERDVLLSDSSELTLRLQKLFNSAVMSVQRDVSGEYSSPVAQQTLHILEGKKKEFVRGEVLEKSCESVVVKNLRNWIIHYPSAKVANLNQNCS
ncbi:MAG: hypothetical protein CMK64_05400 [Pseudoalteromonas sp.]|nr:hypothetical protein [Pseudoalteromonas sp.]|tara:strand:- start:6418 stop:7278 length:861 start_codon:yes stop_codon:yes gene_type:complete